MSKSNGGKTTYVPTEFQFYAPKEKQTFGQVIYNSKYGTYFGRTPKSWAQLMIFYGIFYIVLAALFAICMQGLFLSLEDSEPKWKLERSLIGNNPGLGFRPLCNVTERGSIIQFNHANKNEKEYWISLLDEFLDEYNNTNLAGGSCSYATKQSNISCHVNINHFGSCSPENHYGFTDNNPCIFLKLNKIYDWVAEYYNDTQDLDDNMPIQLKNHIKSLPKSERNQIWVSCEGINAKDKESMNSTQFKYFPYQGFPGYYYPYRNQDNYLSPLIAVQFSNVTPSSLMNIECRAWAKNIQFSSSMRDRKGSVAFQLLID